MGPKNVKCTWMASVAAATTDQYEPVQCLWYCWKLTGTSSAQTYAFLLQSLSSCSHHSWLFQHGFGMNSVPMQHVDNCMLLFSETICHPLPTAAVYRLKSVLTITDFASLLKETYKIIDFYNINHSNDVLFILHHIKSYKVSLPALCNRVTSAKKL